LASAAAPRVTVFMPVYDRAKQLPLTIDSVLAQTFEDFEFLIVDDGSRDDSVEVVRAYDDPRIRLVVQESNQGIPRTRNHGIDLARGEYLAHADSDDYVYPNRLERQVGFLDRNEEIAAVGSWMSRMDASGRVKRGPLVRPTHPREIRGRILFATCFKNPTMMARTHVMREFRFREQFAICSDIDLWGRVSAHHPLANLPEVLMRYRSGGTSHADDAPQRRMRELIAHDRLEELPLDFDERDVANHVTLRNLAGFEPDAEFLAWADDWLARLLAANARCGQYPEPEFSRAAAERWLLLRTRAPRLWSRGDARRLATSLSRVAGGWPGYFERVTGWLEGSVLRPRA
jgi:hypothetical protein